MKWLVPLGFLGLLGLVVLLIIYLIKPNYQKKAVSSTYVWKLSLKFRKKRNPINRLQDLLLLICQILAILACTFVMAQPVLAAFRPEPVTQKVCIIDGSASMLAETDGETRFDRAVQQIGTLAQSVTEGKGEITVIVAGETADYVSVRTTADTLSELSTKLDDMLGNAIKYCCYGPADVEGAMRLAEQVLNQTPQADVLFYTAKSYIDKGTVEIVDVSDPSEYNVAILDGQAVLEENYYTFEVELASYGRDVDLFVNCEVYGVNDDESAVVRYQLPIWLEGDAPQTLLFNSETTGSSGIYAYQYAYISISVNDSFSYDNMFYLYGGTKETIRIQYSSEIPNTFFRGCIMSLRDTLRSKWNIEYVEVNTLQKDAATEGFDFYIFERSTPRTMPRDGVVMFVNPPSMPEGSGVNMSSYVLSGNLFLSLAGEHDITKGLVAERIFVSECRSMTLSDEFEVLLTCMDTPAYAIKNTLDSKLIVMGFELQNSDLPLLIEFPRLFFQTFQYFFPSTIQNYNFEVGETVELNARAPSLTVRGQGEEITLTDFPAEITLSECGTYTLSQTLFNGKNVLENFYVKIPNAESDFTTAVEELANPYVETVPEDEDYDLLLYLAGALALLLIAEWCINGRMQ